MSKKSLRSQLKSIRQRHRLNVQEGIATDIDFYNIYKINYLLEKLTELENAMKAGKIIINISEYEKEKKV